MSENKRNDNSNEGSLSSFIKTAAAAAAVGGACYLAYNIFQNELPSSCTAETYASSSLDNKVPKETLVCNICYEKEREVCFFPCRHFCTCRSCAQALKKKRVIKCPMCNGIVEHMERIYA